MQNILFLIFRLYGGGAERVVSNLSTALSEQYNVKIAIFDKPGKTYPYSGELLHIKLPFSDDPIQNSWWQRAIRLFILVHKVRRLKKKYKINIAVSFGEPANIINVLSGAAERTIVSVRTVLSKEIVAHRMWITRLLAKLLYNKANSIIVPSDASRQDLVSTFQIKNNKIRVIPNYIEQDRISLMANLEIENGTLGKLFKKDVLLNVGRITPAKGQWLLLELMTNNHFLQRDIKLVIVGEAESEGRLKWLLLEKARRLGLRVYDYSTNQELNMDYDVYLLGFQENPYQFMKRSKLLLFPSLFEGFPNTVLEAMQCRLPVMVADCNSVTREILAPGKKFNHQTEKLVVTENGILCPTMTEADIHKEIPSSIVKEWNKGIEILLSDEALQESLRTHGQNRVKDFNKSSIISQWKAHMGQA